MFPEDILAMRLMAYIMLPLGIIMCLMAVHSRLRARKSRSDVDKKMYATRVLRLTSLGTPLVSFGVIGVVVLSTSASQLTLAIVMLLGFIANASLIVLSIRAWRAEEQYGNAVVYEDNLWKFLSGG